MKNIKNINGAKEVTKVVNELIIFKDGPHRPNMGLEELLWFALNADAAAFFCRILKVSLMRAMMCKSNEGNNVFYPIVCTAV